MEKKTLFSKDIINFIMSADNQTDRNRRFRAYAQEMHGDIKDQVKPDRGVGDSFSAAQKKKIDILVRRGLNKFMSLGLKFEDGKKPRTLAEAVALKVAKNPNVKDPGHTTGEAGKDAKLGSYYMRK